MARRVQRQKQKTFAAQLLDLPLFLLIIAVFSVSMIIPALHGGATRALETARAFLYSGILGVMIFGMIALALAGRTPKFGALGSLMALFSTFVFLPVFLALPFFEGAGTTTYFAAYVEMVSSLTTTGATLFTAPGEINDTLHLWRAQVGWMGGLLMWIAASAILAPLNLGGFEVTAQAEPGQRESQSSLIDRANPRTRLLRVTGTLAPIYVMLTVVLWVLLMISGDRSIVALCHAMSVMATSGISPVNGLEGASAGLTGEALMMLFMLFALSRLTFSSDTVTATTGGLRTDPEFRIGLIIVIGVPLILVLRHWIGAFETSAEDQITDVLLAFWGAFFTVLSFLTTTGFTSAQWLSAQSWSALATSWLILLGLALIGGGVATTAGGVKLLRVFALYLNGRRELERLVHPSSVGRIGGEGRRIQRNGAFIAWIFFMLFALTLTALTLLFALLGVDLENAIVFSIAGLSTTGPLITYASEDPRLLSDLGTYAQLVFCAAMVLGRLETLAIIALLTPDLWRN